MANFMHMDAYKGYWPISLTFLKFINDSQFKLWAKQIQMLPICRIYSKVSHSLLKVLDSPPCPQHYETLLREKWSLIEKFSVYNGSLWQDVIFPVVQSDFLSYKYDIAALKLNITRIWGTMLLIFVLQPSHWDNR